MFTWKPDCHELIFDSWIQGYLQYGVPSVLNHDTLLALINKVNLITNSCTLIFLIDDLPRTKQSCNIQSGNSQHSRQHNQCSSDRAFHIKESRRFTTQRGISKYNITLLKKHTSHRLNSYKISTFQILGKEKDCKEMIVGELYGVETPDPNIIFALCCGMRSSPAVSTWSETTLNRLFISRYLIEASCMFWTGEDIHGGGRDGGAGAVEAGISAGCDNGERREEDRSSSASANEHEGFRSWQGIFDGVGVPAAADVGIVEEIDRRLLQGRSWRERRSCSCREDTLWIWVSVSVGYMNWPSYVRARARFWVRVFVGLPWIGISSIVNCVWLD